MIPLALLSTTLALTATNPLRSRLWVTTFALGAFLLAVGLVLALVGPAPVVMRTLPA